MYPFSWGFRRDDPEHPEMLVSRENSSSKLVNQSCYKKKISIFQLMILLGKHLALSVGVANVCSQGFAFVNYDLGYP